MLIGFIGQGYIGKAYADNYEKRGYEVVRIDVDSTIPNEIRYCDIVFIAVPAPTIAREVRIDIIETSLRLVGKDKIAVIKSTIPPGTVTKLQEQYPEIYVMHSPEFLRAKTAKKDAANPLRNIIGISDKPGSRKRAQMVMKTLPKAKHKHVIPSIDAELVKYANNVYLTLKVIYANIIHDVSETIGADSKKVLKIIGEDQRIGNSHLDVFKDGRGAGGLCFIKDFAAFNGLVQKINNNDIKGYLLLAEAINVNLLASTNKDLEILATVYEQSGNTSPTTNRRKH